jgi:hypothetical protein
MKIIRGLLAFIQTLLNGLFKFIGESIFLIVIMIVIAIYLYLEENPRQIKVTKLDQEEVLAAIYKYQAYLELYSNVNIEKKDYRNELWENLEMKIHVRNNVLNRRTSFLRTWRLKNITKERGKIVQELGMEYGVDLEPLFINNLKYYNTN